jgi:hypothetical protein
MDQSAHFVKWLNDFYGYLGLSESEKRDAADFFRRHQAAVSQWCKDKNRFSISLDDTMTPNFLPYSSFLWQWCAACERDLHERERYAELSRDIRLPSRNTNLQRDLSDCWLQILQDGYIPFVFDGIMPPSGPRVPPA